jgi:hypothetical protein
LCDGVLTFLNPRMDKQCSHGAVSDATRPILGYMTLMRLLLAITAVIGLLLGPVGASARPACPEGGMDRAQTTSMATSMAVSAEMSAMADDHACCDDDAPAPDQAGAHKAPASAPKAGAQKTADCGKACAMACCGVSVPLLATAKTYQPVARVVRPEPPAADTPAVGRSPPSPDRPPRAIA